MQEIMHYSKEHSNLSVPQALEALVQSYQSQPNQLQQLAQGNPALLQQMQQGNRTPNGPMMGQRQGSEAFANMSPAMQSGLLPHANGSPHFSAGNNPMALQAAGLVGNAHTPSPGQAHMPAPMVAQQSQQGSATGASANTSPNVSTKRRRSTAAGVKNEVDDPSGEVNGAGANKIKPSPRMGGTKRVKANN
jgi:hypothetical protein